MKKTFTLVFVYEFQKDQFEIAVGDINEQDFASMCKISIEESYRMTAEIHKKFYKDGFSVEFTIEELRCLTIYFGRNPTGLSPLSPIHRNFLKLAQDAGFEVEKPVWEKPKNALKFTDEELKALKKLFNNAGWRNYLLDMHKSFPEENLAAKSFCGKILTLIKEMEKRESSKTEGGKIEGNLKDLPACRDRLGHPLNEIKKKKNSADRPVKPFDRL
ncbi:hypothetical protein KJ603_01700 [Patescibacteria group bacterium]|nr:hypothetical protein [Patescibacteria group bacterium]